MTNKPTSGAFFASILEKEKALRKSTTSVASGASEITLPPSHYVLSIIEETRAYMGLAQKGLSGNTESTKSSCLNSQPN